jgi:hypothetical protein
MLLEVDAFDEPLGGISVPQSAWENELGELELDEVPMAMQRALSPGSIHQFDMTAVGMQSAGLDSMC